MNREQILNMIACHRIQIQALKLQRNQECKVITDNEHSYNVAKAYNDDIKAYNDDIKILKSKL